MVQVAPAIEDYTADALRESTLSDRFTDSSCRFKVTTCRAAQLLCRGGSRDQGLALEVVDDLRVDVIQAAIDGQARPCGAAANLPTNAPVNRLSHYCSARICHVPSTDF